MAAEKRIVFRSAWLPWVLLAPQVLVIAVFFFWPAAQALLQSLQQSDAFGTSVEWVGLENFRNLWNDETYIASFQTTALFSILVAVFGIGLSLMLAVFADRVVKGATIYSTLLVWPYAVAPAVAGV
ncbi:MAG: glycerol-3-phosphate transporter permease, partial [Actinobacteria bacterium]